MGHIISIKVIKVFLTRSIQLLRHFFSAIQWPLYATSINRPFATISRFSFKGWHKVKLPIHSFLANFKWRNDIFQESYNHWILRIRRTRNIPVLASWKASSCWWIPWSGAGRRSTRAASRWRRWRRQRGTSDCDPHPMIRHWKNGFTFSEQCFQTTMEEIL